MARRGLTQRAAHDRFLTRDPSALVFQSNEHLKAILARLDPEQARRGRAEHADRGRLEARERRPARLVADVRRGHLEAQRDARLRPGQHLEAGLENRGERPAGATEQPVNPVARDVLHDLPAAACQRAVRQRVSRAQNSVARGANLESARP